MYSGDFDDRAPLRDSWMDDVGPYVKNGLLFHCPTVEGLNLYGYALNAGVKRIDERYVHPNTTPLIYDSVNQARNASDLVTSLPEPGRHDGWDNMVYIDGHAKSIRPSAGSAP